MEIGRKLKVLLKQKGLSQAEFSKILEVDQSHLNRVLNNDRMPNFELLTKILGYFGDVDLNWLLRDSYKSTDSIPKVNEAGALPNAEILTDVEEIEQIIRRMKGRLAQ